jgi:hypothetical protein
MGGRKVNKTCNKTKGLRIEGDWNEIRKERD